MTAIRALLSLSNSKKRISGVTIDLTSSGALIQSLHPAPVGARGRLELMLKPPLSVDVTVVRVDPEAFRPMYGVGLQFGPLTPEAREALKGRSAWEIESVPGGCRVRMRTGFTEATNFASLLTAIDGDVTFDVSEVRQISSIGVKKWVYFLERLGNGRSVSFARCSPQFVNQAAMIRNFLGQGTVRSVLVPYCCPDCEHESEEELGLENATSPAMADTVGCAQCGGEMELDVIPEVYLSFLE